MATDGTIESGLFQETFKEYDIDFIVPDEDNQKKVMSLIYNDIKAGKNHRLISSLKLSRCYRMVVLRLCC